MVTPPWSTLIAREPAALKPTLVAQERRAKWEREPRWAIHGVYDYDGGPTSITDDGLLAALCRDAAVPWLEQEHDVIVANFAGEWIPMVRTDCGLVAMRGSRIGLSRDEAIRAGVAAVLDARDALAQKI